VRAPAEAGTGTAKVVLSFAGCEEAEVAPAVVEVAVVKPEAIKAKEP
jgi:hypothetical protein